MNLSKLLLIFIGLNLITVPVEVYMKIGKFSVDSVMIYVGITLISIALSITERQDRKD